MAATLVAASIPAFALEDGAYTISRQTSYVNPDTGETEDGGTNIALGDSMCASIVEDQLLVEKSGGKTYITIGLGLASNISNVRILVQDESGEYRDVEITKTGSCERDGDTCNHYRFEVTSEDNKISPIIYVTPMGRDVQFFVIPDTSTAQAGTGNFVSEMVQTTTETTNISEKSTSNETTEKSQTTETQPTETTSSEETTSNTETSVEQYEDNQTESNSSKNHKTVWIIGGIVVLCVAGGCIWYFCFFKKKRQ